MNQSAEQSNSANVRIDKEKGEVKRKTVEDFDREFREKQRKEMMRNVSHKRIKQQQTTQENSRGRRKNGKPRNLDPSGKGTPPGQREKK